MIGFDIRRFEQTCGYSVSDAQREGVLALAGFIAGDDSVCSVSYAAYLFATVELECAHLWRPVIEKGSRAYFDKKYEGLLVLNNVQSGDGYLFRGRGYVQITGRRNYTVFSTILGIDLVRDPDQALIPDVAYQIFSIGVDRGIFTGARLTHYCNADRADYLDARVVINGRDRAADIAGRAQYFETLMSIEADAVPLQEAETNV